MSRRWWRLARWVGASQRRGWRGLTLRLSSASARMTGSSPTRGCDGRVRSWAHAVQLMAEQSALDERMPLTSLVARLVRQRSSRRGGNGWLAGAELCASRKGVGHP
jgi:hypothetical protein